jgi:diguanylate cyclase (GGDEF)-like protein
MSNLELAIAEQLKALYAAFAAKIPEKVFQIVQEWWNCQSDNFNPSRLENLFALTESLVETADGYGIVAREVAEAARELENYVRVLLEETPSSNTHLAEGNLLIAHLQEVSTNSEKFQQQLPNKQIEGSNVLTEMKHIFLIEEDQNLAQDLAIQIGYFGYTIHTFVHIKAAIEMLTHIIPAAIIMDVQFPEGQLADSSFIYQIENIQEEPTPIIFVSSRDDLPARLQAVRLGGKAYFTKPVDVSGLIDTLDSITNAPTPEPYHVLIVEDDRFLATYYSRILKQAGMVTNVVTAPVEVLNQLNDFVPDLILMDLYMPNCTGLELAAVIRQQPAYVSVPIVFLSAETNLDKQMAAMQLGGDDFLTKPIRPNHLISSVSARAQRSRILRSFMIRDSLTGLLNHTRTKEQLELEIARAARKNSPLVFVLLDIDLFKSVNDNYGHLVGDRVLKSLSRLLQQRLRKSDIIGRYGGEEFAIILTDTDGDSAYKVMDEIRNRFSQIRHQHEEETFHVTFSCGLAVFPDNEDAVTLTSQADKALYQAKNAGRNQVYLSTPETEYPH